MLNSANECLTWSFAAEAYVGGPIALVEDGDIITVDVRLFFANHFSDTSL